MLKMLIFAGLLSLISFGATAQQLQEQRDGYSDTTSGSSGQIPCRFNCALSSGAAQALNQQSNTAKKQPQKQTAPGNQPKQ